MSYLERKNKKREKSLKDSLREAINNVPLLDYSYLINLIYIFICHQYKYFCERDLVHMEDYSTDITTGRLEICQTLKKAKDMLGRIRAGEDDQDKIEEAFNYIGKHIAMWWD